MKDSVQIFVPCHDDDMMMMMILTMMMIIMMESHLGVSIRAEATAEQMLKMKWSQTN